jgi:hypothetical protein
MVESVIVLFPIPLPYVPVTIGANDFDVSKAFRGVIPFTLSFKDLLAGVAPGIRIKVIGIFRVVPFMKTQPFTL